VKPWPARTARNGARLMSLVLAALIAAEAARTAIVLYSPGARKSPQPANPAATAAYSRRGIDVESIVAAHLFGVAIDDLDSRDPALARPTSANFVLAGTIATGDPRRGMAIISDAGVSKVYSVGDSLGDLSLYSVYLDRVILRRGSTLESLVLPRLLLSSRPAPASRTAAGTGDASDGNGRVPEDKGILRLIGSFDNDAAKGRGYRVFPGRNRKAFMSLGLHPGDLVTSVNGTPLDDSQGGQRALGELAAADRAIVTIRRGKQTQEISLNMTEAALETH
jgi:general secretion pathway protein C